MPCWMFSILGIPMAFSNWSREHFLNVLGGVRGSCITFMTGIISKLVDLRNKLL